MNKKTKCTEKRLIRSEVNVLRAFRFFLYSSVEVTFYIMLCEHVSETELVPRSFSFLAQQCRYLEYDSLLF